VCFQRLKPKHDEPLSTFAYNFNLRRYNKEGSENVPVKWISEKLWLEMLRLSDMKSFTGRGFTLVHFSAQPKAFWSVSRFASSS
jgi:hypothetical protein